MLISSDQYDPNQVRLQSQVQFKIVIFIVVHLNL